MKESQRREVSPEQPRATRDEEWTVRGRGHIKGCYSSQKVGSGWCLNGAEGTVSQGDTLNKHTTRESPGHAPGMWPVVRATVYCQLHGSYNHLGDRPLAHLLGVVLVALRWEDPATVDKDIAWLESWTV